MGTVGKRLDIIESFRLDCSRTQLRGGVSRVVADEQEDLVEGNRRWFRERIKGVRNFKNCVRRGTKMSLFS